MQTTLLYHFQHRWFPNGKNPLQSVFLRPAQSLGADGGRMVGKIIEIHVCALDYYFDLPKADNPFADDEGNDIYFNRLGNNNYYIKDEENIPDSHHLIAHAEIYLKTNYFDQQVEGEGPIKQTEVADPAFIFYHLDSICVTSDATNMYLEYDISTSSNVTWTRLSIADIFISFNTLGFGNPPNISFDLYPEFNDHSIGLIYDFASTLSHELGHAHFLGHNVENDEIMFTTYDENLEGPGSNDILGGKDVVKFSIGWLSTGDCASILPHNPVTCGTNTITDNSMDLCKINIYPNPFVEQFSLSTSCDNLGESNIEVFDLFGKKVLDRVEDLSLPNGQSLTIHLGKLVPMGSYLIRITSESGRFSHLILKH